MIPSCRLLRSTFLTAAFAWVLATTAIAHDAGLSGLAVIVAPDHVEATLTFARGDLHALVGSDENAEFTRDGLRDLASRALLVTTSGRPVPAGEIQIEPRAVNNDVAFHFRYPRSASDGEWILRSALLRNLAPGHRQYLSVRDASGHLETERLLQADGDSFSLPRSQILVVPPVDPFFGFLRMGLMHILTGYDHLLFLAALLIVSRTFASSLKIISCFTLGHSITLALATLDIVNVPSRVVEPLIAASILFISIENLVRHGEPKGRYVITFAFGLIHGLGFATALREMGVGVSGDGVVLALLGFNLGVEAGQLGVAAVVLPAFAMLRHHPEWTLRWAPACSVLVATAGAYWLVERITGFGG